MNNPTDKPQGNMYGVVFPVPDVTGSEGHLTLVIALSGYADAGSAVSESVSFLLNALGYRSLVNFSIDELIDYRSRRLAVTMNHDQTVDVSDSNLSLNVVRDNVGRPLLLLSGPEPNMRWEAFSTAVADLTERYDAGRTVSLCSASMTVPHTRPLGIIAHGTDKRKLSDMYIWDNRVTAPDAASLNIEYELASRGCDTFGFTAQVPHHVATSEYPLTSLRLLQEAAEPAKLELPLEALEKEFARVAELLNTQANDSGEVSRLVNLLEEQYGQEVQRRQGLETSPLPGPNGKMPSADEIGAEFEKFLVSQPLRSVEDSSSLDDGAKTLANADSSVATSEDTDTHSEDPESSSTDDRSAELSADDTAEQPESERPTSEQLRDEQAESEESGEPKKPCRQRGWKPWFRF